MRSILDATYRDGAGVDRLVQHSAGSGKSNTIAWTAHALSRLHGADDAPIFDKVVVITDRKVLDRQLQDTVAGLEHTPGTIVRIDENSAPSSREALEGHAARVIITTLQKFPVVAEVGRQGRADGGSKGVVGRRFAVIVDEAHSSSVEIRSPGEEGPGFGEGDAELEAAAEAEQAAYDASVDAADEALFASARHRGKQKNLSFFAFTATPKPKTSTRSGRSVRTGTSGRSTRTRCGRRSRRVHPRRAGELRRMQSRTTMLANAHPRNDPEMESGKGGRLCRFASLHPYALARRRR